MGRVMVTGGAGFVGRRLTAALAHRGDGVVVYDVGPPSPDGDGRIAYERGDLGDLSRLARVCGEHGIDRIVHAAAIFDPVFSQASPYTTYVTNVLGTINVIEAARLTGVGPIVLVSTGAAYQAVEREPITEDHSIFASREGTPAGHYGASKAAADVIGLTYASSSGVDVRIVRYSGVYGDGMRHDLYVKSMVEAAAVGRMARFPTGGDMKRDYLYVKDAVRGTLAALDADGEALVQRVFNIASGELVTTRELADVVRSLSGTDVEVGAGLTEFERSDIRTRGQIDIGAAASELGYVPEYDLRRGVAEYLEHVRDRSGLAERVAR